MEENITRDTELLALASQDMLSVRALNCCNVADIYTLGQLLDTPLVELKKIRNLGQHTFTELCSLRANYKELYAEPTKEPFRVGSTIFIPCYKLDSNSHLNEFMINLNDVISIEKAEGDAMIRCKHEIDKFLNVYNCIYSYETLIEKLQKLK